MELRLTATLEGLRALTAAEAEERQHEKEGRAAVRCAAKEAALQAAGPNPSRSSMK